MGVLLEPCTALFHRRYSARKLRCERAGHCNVLRGALIVPLMQASQHGLLALQTTRPITRVLPAFVELLLQLVLLLSHLLGELLEELPRGLLLPEDPIGVAFHGVVLPSRLAFFSPLTGPVFQYRRRLFLIIRPGEV